MSVSRSLRLFNALVALGFALMSAGQPAWAATFTWDASGNGSSFDGAGAWGLAGSNWWTGASDQVWPNTTDTAIFGSGVGGGNPYTVTLSNGGSAINAGGLVFQNQAYTLQGDPLALTGATPSVTVNAARATIGSAITGSAGLVKAGTGLLDISGINTYGGNTTIAGGTLELPAGGTINNAGQIIVGGSAGATFNLSGGAVTTSNSGYALYVGQNSGQPGAVNITGGALTIAGTIGLGDNGNGTYNQTGGVVTVAGGFRMSNNPSSVAVASITGGSLTTTTGGTTGGIILAYGGAGQITGGTGTMTIGGNAVVTTPRVAMVGYTGNTSSSPSLGTLNLDGGTLTTGYVSLNYNTFNNTPQSIWGTGVLNFNGGVLQASTINGTFVSGLSAAYVKAGGANISTIYPLDIISQPLLHDPNLTINDGGLTKTGSGTLTLSGANTFNGPTTVSLGTLTVANALALQNSTVNSSGGAISISASSATFGGLTGSGNLTGPSGTLSIGNNGANTTYTGAIGGSGALAKLGNGMLTLAGANTYSSANGTVLSGGTLAADFSQPGAPTANILPSGTPVTINQGTLAFLGGSGATNSQTLGNLTFNGVANFILTPNGAAGLSVSAGNTWTRNSGSAVNFALGAPSGSGTLGASPALNAGGIIAGPNNTAYATFGGTDWATVSGGSIAAYTGYSANNYTGAGVNTDITAMNPAPVSITSDTLAFRIAQSNTLTLPDVVTLGAGGVLVGSQVGANATTIAGGSLTSATGDLVVHQFNTGTLTISSVLLANGASSPSLVKAGPGTTVLTGANTYSGPTIVGGGSLVGSTSAIPTAVTLQNGANVNYQQDANATLATGVSGNGSFSKSGSGMLTLTGSSTYSGATTISGGTLQLGAAVGITGFGGSGAPAGWGLHGFNLHAVPPAPVFWSGAGNPYPSVVTNNLAVLTTSPSGGEAASMFYLATQPVVGQPWQAKFTYTNVNGNGDNGGAFVLQMGHDGPYTPTDNVMGQPESAKGLTFGSNNPIYHGIPYTSAEIVWNIYGGSQLDFTTRTNSNTSTPTGNGVNLDAASSPVDITLSYDGVSTIYLTAQQGSNVWTQLYTGANLAAALASPAGGLAYVGFTGGNNTASTEQDLANFSLSYQNLPAATPVNLTVAGATLDLNGIPQEIGSLSGVTGAHVSLGGGILNTGGDNTSTTFAGSISGGGVVVKTGTGTFTLSASNSYANGTVVSGGAIVAQTNYSIGTGPLTINPAEGSAAAYFTSASPSVSSLASAGAGAAGVVLGNVSGASSTTLTVGSDNSSTTFAGSIKDAGPSPAVGALVKTGTGVMVLSGSNTYSGGTSVQSGVLQLSFGGSLPLNSQVSIGAQGTVDLGGVNSTFASLSDGSGGGSVINSNTGATAVLTLAPTGGSTTFSGAIQSGGALGPLNLVMSGYGTQILAGANVNTQATTVQGGVLDIAGTGSSASATNVSAGVFRLDGAWSASVLNVTRNSDGTGQGSGQLAGSGAIALTGSDGMHYNSTAASAFSGDITAPSGGLQVDNGTLVLSGTNNFAAGAVVLGGTLVLADNQALADGSSLTVGNASYFPAPTLPSPAAIVPVPEPGTLVLVVAGAILAFGVGRRRGFRDRLARRTVS